MITMLMTLAMTPPAAAMTSPCVVSVAATAFEGDVDRTEASLARRDSRAFVAGLADLTDAIPCLSEPAPSEPVARYFLFLGLLANSQGDDAGAEAYFRASRDLQPDYVIPDSLLPPDHSGRLKFEGVPQRAPRFPALPAARDGTVWFDGTQTMRRPTDRPTLAQFATDPDAVMDSRVLDPGDPMLSYRAVPRARNRWLTVAASGAALGLVSYSGAWIARGAFHAEGPDVDGLRDLQTATLGLTVASGAFFGVSATGVIGASVAWAR